MDGRLRHRGTRIASLAIATLAVWGCRGRPAPAGPAPAVAADEAYRASVAALMWPGATRAYQVTAGGDLFDGAWYVRMTPRCDTVTAGPPERIAYEGRWCPVTRWTRAGGGLRWDFEAVAFPEPEPSPWSPRGLFARQAVARDREADRRSDRASFAGIPREHLAKLLFRAPTPLVRDPVDRRNLFVSMRVTVRNLGPKEADARIALRGDPPGGDAPWRDADSLVRVPWEHFWRAAGSGDSLVGLADGEVRDRELVRRWRLGPGEQAAWDVVVAAYPAPRAVLEALARVPHERRAEDVRAYWRRETARGASFDVPDPEVRCAVLAARVVLLASRERRDVDWVSVGGPFHYRDVWIRDGVRVAQALAVSGYTRESRECAHALLRFRTPFGSFVSQSGQLDGTGQVLWAFEQTMLRPSPAPELRQYADAALEGWRALEQLRGLTRASDPGTMPGMLPATDPHDNELVRAQLVGNDAWSLAGYRAAVRLLRARGESSSTDEVERSRREYLAAFRETLHRSGRPDVSPSWQGGGIDWGNLNVGYPCEVLDPGDPRLDSLARRYWAPVGGPGLGYYRNPDSLHTYVAADLATVAMLAGDRAAADRILDATLHWRSASGGAAECFQASTRDFGRNFPPHTTAAAALISMVRNALVFDDGDTLALALGARAAWWRGTVVRRAPTRWGPLDLRFRRAGDAATWRWTAVPVWTLLTLPPGTRPAAVPAPLRPGPRPDQVLAPPGSTEAHVVLARETRS